MRVQLNWVEVIGASARNTGDLHGRRRNFIQSLATLMSWGFLLSQHTMAQAAYRRPRSHGAWSIIASKIGPLTFLPFLLSRRWRKETRYTTLPSEQGHPFKDQGSQRLQEPF